MTDHDYDAITLENEQLRAALAMTEGAHSFAVSLVEEAQAEATAAVKRAEVAERSATDRARALDACAARIDELLRRGQGT